MKIMKNNDNDFTWTEKLVQQYIDNNNYQKLNTRDRFSDTGFMWACEFQPELAKIMLKRDDIDFNIQDKFGWTGFIKACKHQPELAEIMLEKDNINFNVQDNMGYTGFMWTCVYQSKLLEKMLNNKEIDKTLKNNNGLTGYDLAKKENQESFEIYQAWLEKDNIKTQVQKRSRKPSQHL